MKFGFKNKIKGDIKMKKISKLLLVITLAFTLVACGTSEAQKSLENTLKNVQTGKVLDPSDKDSVTIAAIFKKMTYQVKKVTENGNTADIEVNIKAVDLSLYMKEYMATMIPLAFAGATEEEIEEKATEFFTELGTRSDLKYIETDVIVRMEKEDGKWNLVNNDDVMDAITGNLSNIFE